MTSKPKAFLTDLDGTLYFKNEPYPGAIEVVNYLRRANYQLRFLTNTTAKIPKMRHEQIRQMALAHSRGLMAASTSSAKRGS